jgi:dipeptidyl aminopeptidase/acylaminoacyl peptidase
VSDPVEAISTNGDVYAVPLAGGEARRLTSGPGWDGIPRPSPDGRQLAWLSMARAGYESDRLRIMVASADGSGAREVAPGLDLPASDLAWAKGGRALRFLALERGVHRLYEVDVRSGKLAALTPPVTPPGAARNVASVSWSADGERAVALLDGLLDPPELARLVPDPKGGARWARVTSHASAALAGVARPSVRELGATAEDGTALHGWIVLPPGAKAGERLPGLLLVHGGPQGAWTDAWTFRWNAMLYAAQGYAVVMPNPRGSSGYGQAFTDAVSRDWGGAPYEDVLALLDAAIESGPVDGGRLCAAGASYGGYMVHWLNANTSRFRCLVAHAGLFDLRMAYYTTEELWFPEWEQGGTPFEAPEAYERFSPSRLAGRMRTPTLVTHGELDYRCTVDQAYAAFTALQRQGVPSKLVIFPDEGHWVLRPQNSKAFYDVVLAWLASHLGARRTATTSAP